MHYKPLIFDIKGNSFEDGPGIRSVIFLKGCPLNCAWCHNPESKSLKAELWLEKEKCIECRECIQSCKKNAIYFNKSIVIDKKKCNECFECVALCPSGALAQIGKEMSVDELIKKILPYKPFFDESNGGVTISGGEATLFPKYVSALLKKLKELNINTLIETSGYFNFEEFKEMILPYTDIIYYDIKLINPIKHKQFCGVSNEIILSNFLKLNKLSETYNFKILPRTPLIPKLTDNIEDINFLINFFKTNKISEIALLPNNPMWYNKISNLVVNEKLEIGNHLISNKKIRNFYNMTEKEAILDYFSKHGFIIV